MLTQLVNDRSVLLATIPLDEWIRLSATTCLSCMPRAKRS